MLEYLLHQFDGHFFMFCLFFTESAYRVLKDKYILGHLKKQLVDLNSTIN